MLTKGRAKIVPAGCFVPNTVDMTRLKKSNRGSFSKGQGRILSLTITFHTDLARVSQPRFDGHRLLLQMAPQPHLLLSMHPVFLTFSQPSVSEKQMSSAIVAHVPSLAESRYPTLGMYRVTPPRQATRSQSLLGPLYCVHSAPRGVDPWCPWN